MRRGIVLPFVGGGLEMVGGDEHIVLLLFSAQRVEKENAMQEKFWSQQVAKGLQNAYTGKQGDAASVVSSACPSGFTSKTSVRAWAAGRSKGRATCACSIMHASYQTRPACTRPDMTTCTHVTQQLARYALGHCTHSWLALWSYCHVSSRHEICLHVISIAMCGCV